jgi:hypothetical protein
MIRRLYCPEDFVARKAATDKARSSEFWIPMHIRSRMLMRNIHVLKVNVDATKAASGAIQRVRGFVDVCVLRVHASRLRRGAPEHLMAKHAPAHHGTDAVTLYLRLILR